MTEAEMNRLNECIAEGKPFSACILPGENILRFDCMRLVPWPGSLVDSTPAPTTPQAQYLTAAAQAIETLKAQDAECKTVLARNISGSFSTFNPAEMAAQYFPAFPDCLRFITYSPEYGFWMGATPEMLLIDNGNSLRTRALAGTRPARTQGQWSQKNIREHIIVLDEIISNMKQAGISLTETPRTYTLPYGTVEHLCTDIEVDKPSHFDTDNLVSLLHPTPAVGGFPRAEAMEQISKLESSPRKLYGGIISVSLHDRSLHYVMLRCVHFNRSNWSVYTGSGLTADSDPMDEWMETKHKASPLINVLSKFGSVSE